jgi:hypothetical protein
MIPGFFRRTICKPCADVYDANKAQGGGNKGGAMASQGSQI